MDVAAIVIGVAGVAVAAWVLRVSRDSKAFGEQFPPISDAEFVTRCSPGTSPEVALKVRRIVADHLAVEYDRIHPSMSFIEDIGAD
jgi:Flp pilus assembly protein TadB